VSYRNKIVFATAILIIVLLSLIFFLGSADRTFINIIGIAGFLLSILGILIAYVQVISIKDISLETQKKVVENIKFYNDILMLSDLARKAAMADEIQGYLKDDKIEMCILRMKDLKVILGNIKNQEFYSTLVSKREFKTVFDNFHHDLDNFQSHNLSIRNKLNKELIIKHLEDMSTMFLNVEVKLKNQNNDTR